MLTSHSSDAPPSERRPRLLAVPHEASRTGAPRVALSFLQWLARGGHAHVDTLLMNGGPLKSAFAAVSTRCEVLDLWTRPKRLDERVVRAVGRDEAYRRLVSSRIRRQLANVVGHDLAYFNSAGSLEILPHLAVGGAPYGVHVHELAWALKYCQTPVVIPGLLGADVLIAASVPVADVLCDLGAQPQRIVVVPEFIDTGAVRNAAQHLTADDIKSQLGVPKHHLLIGACGTRHWRKGPDLFLQLVARVRAVAPCLPVSFVWVGGDPTSLDSRQLDHDLERLPGADRVHLVPEVADPLPWLAAFDILALTSREDPFPLVCLEAAVLGVPTVCFSGSGGMPDLLRRGCGRVVPYLDVAGMADTLVELAQTPKLRQELGRHGEHLVSTEYDTAVLAPQLWEALRAPRPAAAGGRRWRP